MTADTSWYGQQTLVHPDYSHQPYQAYGDPHAGYQQQYGYPEQHGYTWPEYYPQQDQYPHAQYAPTVVAEYPAFHEQGAYYQAYQGYQGYEAPPGHYPDYSAYETVTDLSFTAPEPEWLAVDVDVAAADFEIPDAAEAEEGPEAEDAFSEQADCAAVRGSRRRATRRRSAVLTIAVPSVVVLGVAGAAAATIGPLRSHHTTPTASAADPAAQTKAQALAAAEARDAAERAARDKARTALQLRNAAARKTAAEAPRYTLPIAYHSGLSALFGQAGTHWMQLHTGIDFPVAEGTPVHAVTGGTVTTEWNPFYGYMVKLTAPDGTVTWYCHLSSYRVRSGHVKVGEIIAYSGDSGNSTGPHLHFEVHPDGGPAVDPLPWLLARGLDPR